MGEWFTSFDDAWAYFVAREEPLESFYAALPDDPNAAIDGWLIEPPVAVKRGALRVQSELEEVLGLRVVPHHFLHVWLRGTHGPDLDQILELPPFELRFSRLNCFHDALVAEAESDELASVDAPPQFLPHLSLAYVELPIEPAPVRDALVPLRGTPLGSFVVDEILRVRVPIAKSTFLQPWTVTERRTLRR